MTDAPPLAFFWDGESFTPAQPRRADQHYVVGETYWLAPYEPRSTASHNHFFASVADAWKHLPETLADQYPTPEHLRKKMLIKAGFRDERSIVCASKAEAQRVAAFIRPVDDYAMVIVRDTVVMHLTAKSQSYRAMGAADFQASKTAVFDEIAEMIGVTADSLRINVGAEA
jgi:hypothetical protein